MPVRTVLERGPKGRKFVAFAVDWPGWSRGAKTPEMAVEVLADYRERYRPVAVAAGMGNRFTREGPALEVIEDKIGTPSTDFWAVSFSPSAAETEPVTAKELDRKIELLQACWAYFDKVGATVSAELQKGPRGGGRDRDRIVRHVVRNESESFAKQVGIRIPEEAALTPAGLRTHRKSYIEAMHAYNTGEGRRMRSWNLPFLIRHSAYHTMDHAWEMEDKDLSG